MDAEKKKPIMIAIVIGCLVLAGAITFFTSDSSRPGGRSEATDEKQLLCVNPDCNAEFTITNKDYDEQLKAIAENMPEMGMGMGMGMVALTCPQCGQQSAYLAIKCSKCQYVFLPNEAGAGKYPDTCPECGYSEYEQKNK